jgi:hypothetical protein
MRAAGTSIPAAGAPKRHGVGVEEFIPRESNAGIQSRAGARTGQKLGGVGACFALVADWSAGSGPSGPRTLRCPRSGTKSNYRGIR